MTEKKKLNLHPRIVADINNKLIRPGHIVAVRYVWNSYVGRVSYDYKLSSTGAERFAFFSGHSIDEEATYQVLSHVDPDDRHYNKEVNDWYNSESGDCPVRIAIYDNI